MMATNMPLSDNNVSTTNMAMVNTAWDMPDSEQDINVSVLTYGQWQIKVFTENHAFCELRCLEKRFSMKGFKNVSSMDMGQ